MSNQMNGPLDVAKLSVGDRYHVDTMDGCIPMVVVKSYGFRSRSLYSYNGVRYGVTPKSKPTHFAHLEEGECVLVPYDWPTPLRDVAVGDLVHQTRTMGLPCRVFEVVSVDPLVVRDGRGRAEIDECESWHLHRPERCRKSS